MAKFKNLVTMGTHETTNQFVVEQYEKYPDRYETTGGTEPEGTQQQMASATVAVEQPKRGRKKAEQDEPVTEE